MSTDAKQRRKRIVVIAGAVGGGVLSLTTSLLMDYLFADSLTGSWREAIAGDLQRAFSLSLSPDSATVYILFIVVLAFMASVGAGIGAFFALIVNRFLNFLES
ncbi:MAG TPA: hypothetical protein ENI12_04715 [Nitrospirae bacterium]|nr:hypothetical protein [Nitrospirota bacterium]